MAKEHPMQALAAYLPDGSFEQVVTYLHQYKVHLTVTKERKRVLGNYAHLPSDNIHRITVNGNLNPFEFLITLLHELAHLLTWVQYQRKAAPHGKEWKQQYGVLLIDFFNFFPPDVQVVLRTYIQNPAATANGETALLLALRQYDQPKKDGSMMLAHLPQGARFNYEQNGLFEIVKKRRTRYECVQLTTGKRYLFSGIAMVEPVTT